MTVNRGRTGLFYAVAIATVLAALAADLAAVPARRIRALLTKER